MKVYMMNKDFNIDLHVMEGDPAPDFYVTDQNFKKLHLKDIKTDFILISSYPSLDTGVCEEQVITFNEKARDLESTTVINVSCDLPFAASRFCIAKSIKHAKPYSDYNKHSLGKSFGLLIEELQLLTRAIIILDKERKVRYFQVVDNVSHQVDFDAALKKLEQL